MKKFSLLAVIAFFNISLLSACTTFFINKDGQLLFGRNYDWVTDAGIVCTNLRGLNKTSMKTRDGEMISWVSRFGSITFNQYGKEFPTGGMNEKGLVVELMWLDETQYPAADTRPAIGVLQWIQYQLDNCATIEEVIATDKKLRIASVGTTPLHYLVADGNGHAATIEFLQGKLVVHQGNDLSVPVLTNSVYDESLSNWKIRGSGSSNNSLQRFGKACNMIEQIEPVSEERSMTDYAFDILSAVAQGDYTKWSIVYDLRYKTIRFRTNRFNQVKIVSFSAFDFACTSVSKSWDMNQAVTGNIDHLFGNFTIDINKRIVLTAADESKDQVSIGIEAREALWTYPAKIRCE